MINMFDTYLIHPNNQIKKCLNKYLVPVYQLAVLKIDKFSKKEPWSSEIT